MTTQRYKTLQEKLQELEAKLSVVFSLPAGSPHHHLHSECIQQRFAFLKNLLSAEIASRPSKSSHLGHIKKRLAELEIAFRDVIDTTGDAVAGGPTSAGSDVCSCGDDFSSLEDVDDGDEATIDLTSPESGGTSEDELDHLQPQVIDPPAPVILTKVIKSRRNHGGRVTSTVSDEEIIIEGQRRNKIKIINSPWAAAPPTLRGSHKYDGEVYVVKQNEGRIPWSGKYWGTLISGMTLGMVLMGAGAAIAMVGDSVSFYSTPPHDGLRFYT